MSESKSTTPDDSESSDELAGLRAQHRLATSPSMDSMARTRELLDEESRVRSGVRERAQDAYCRDDRETIWNAWCYEEGE